MHEVFNASNVFGAVAFFSLMLAPAFVEENPIMSVVMTVVFAGSAYMALKEDGQLK